MADTRNCEQCGSSFAPRREHARFCSARCRVAWNRHNASDSPAESGPLDWSITAMRETTDRLLRSGGLDQVNGFAVISEAVWWVTMVDATLMRYQPDTYSSVLAGQEAAERRIIEDTFGGLRFVRNRMGYDTDHAEFIQPLEAPPGIDRIAAWTWKSVSEPVLVSLAARAREWELTRYRAYQAQLAGRPIGETFGAATAFLRLAVEGASPSTLIPT
jgi:hypothetical protein